eukprot:CAMPEP_0197656978 /NCGR_PEP_ID=MMETSP1338-20131121/44237_1 /TAXON_ID=43686 ORGANISM="Pelagodinium beii, Strain RCC1491" /NCGR_SAMPLE_ID=MMETSP1338 /ASSEMBLY_ACC=CAM_ASM_000754 /LENGTH=89 /DNA_ID=CAMNT_0043233241 /DNA_START=54 /DNA_END=324 /DNA_ORIENTATION=-
MSFIRSLLMLALPFTALAEDDHDEPAPWTGHDYMLAVSVVLIGIAVVCAAYVINDDKKKKRKGSGSEGSQKRSEPKQKDSAEPGTAGGS